MLQINWDDVWKVVDSVKLYLIVIVAAIIAAIVIAVAVKGVKKPLRGLIRGEALVAMLLAILVSINLMCTGPLNTLLTSSFGKPVSKIDDATTAQATELVNEICREGIVLLKDENAILPLQGKKINVFGWSAVNPCYGGTGSGALNKSYPTTTFLDSLDQAGIEYNKDLIQFYDDYTAKFQQMDAYKATSTSDAVMLPNVGMWAQNWTLPQPYAKEYSSSLLDGAKSYSDTAVIFIARVGGEGADLPTDMTAVVDGSWANDQVKNATYFAGTYDDTVNDGKDWDAGDHYLQLSNPEEELVELVCKNFDNVVVIYNSANAFELGFLNDYPQIKGAIQCAGTGQSGFTALGQVLAGEVNPSGHLVDTYLYHLKAAPTWNNMGNHVYDNMSEFLVESKNRTTGEPVSTYPTFVNYNEGIYVGYKFFETAAEEGLIDYGKVVQYPFGYGLSYTSFKQEITNLDASGDDVYLEVQVTNTGSVAGKDVVEVYLTPPYTNGGIEKASVNLLDFGKTKALAPGESEVLGFTIPKEQMASYDDRELGCYVLEGGKYTISIRSDSHTVLDETSFNENKIVYGPDNKRPSDFTAAVNQFDYARGDVEYLSRKDGFANYAAAVAAPKSYSMSASDKASFYNVSNYLADASAPTADEDANATAPTFGAKNGIKLASLRGLAYDDPKWEQLLDQLTLSEICNLIALGGYQTLGIDSIEKYRTNDCDGPASINNNFTGQGSVGFPAAVMIASTWNDELAYQFGDSIGEMADQMDTAGWYGPAMNTHRTAFAGRNFEYYSEDGVLSGSMAANAILGAQAHGVYAYMKHFALNDQECNRCSMLCTWSTEQAMREIYLKPFEIAVKEGGSLAVMSSFNYIGNRWAGGSASLCENVLRGEWGFKGFVETDYFGVYGYMNSDQAVRNGTDLCLVNYETTTSQMQFRDTAGAQQAARQSAHRILYVVVNSRQYSELGVEQSTQPNRWETVLKTVNIAGAVVLVGLEVLLILSYRKKSKTA